MDKIENWTKLNLINDAKKHLKKVAGKNKWYYSNFEMFFFL